MPVVKLKAKKMQRINRIDTCKAVIGVLGVRNGKHKCRKLTQRMK